MLLISSYRRSAVKYFTLGMFLWNQCCSVKEDPVPPSKIAVTGAFVTLYGYSLKGPKLERHSCRSMLDCGHLCLRKAKCFSFNFQVSTVGSGLCELSEQTISLKEESNTLMRTPDFVFVQTVTKDLVSGFPLFLRNT